MYLLRLDAKVQASVEFGVEDGDGWTLSTGTDDVRKHFVSHPDNRCVPLLLNAFGEGDGHGVYQLVEDAVLSHPADVVADEGAHVKL